MEAAEVVTIVVKEGICLEIALNPDVRVNSKKVDTAWPLLFSNCNHNKRRAYICQGIALNPDVHVNIFSTYLCLCTDGSKRIKKCFVLYFENFGLAFFILFSKN